MRTFKEVKTEQSVVELEMMRLTDADSDAVFAECQKRYNILGEELCDIADSKTLTEHLKDREDYFLSLNK